MVKHESVVSKALRCFNPTEALFLIFLIDEMEYQEVSTVDITREFMQEDMEVETVHIKIEGKMVKIMTKLDPKLYCKYITTEKGRPVSDIPNFPH